jgi:hypothetical protein
VADDLKLKARRLDAIAEWINKNSVTLRMVAYTEPSWVSTARPKPKGLRYRVHEGKGRKGVLFRAFGADANGSRIRDAPAFFEHNSAETYRVNAEVEQWLAKYIRGLDAAHRRKLGVPAKVLNYWTSLAWMR